MDDETYVCLRVCFTPLKSAPTASWLTASRMLLQARVAFPLLQAGSLSVFESELRSDCKDLRSLVVASCNVSKDVLTFSKASLVSRIA